VSSVVLLAGTLATGDLSGLPAVPPAALAAFLGAGLISAVTLGEVPGAVTVLAMALIVAGVYVTVGTGASPSAGSSGAPPASWRGTLLGLGTAACWAVSPLLIREGLREVPAPVLGATISMLAATIPMGTVVALRRRRPSASRPGWTRSPSSSQPGSWSGCPPGPAGRRWR
jgi:drug/metabolite transporter (DMT)-like permease